MTHKKCNMDLCQRPFKLIFTWGAKKDVTIWSNKNPKNWHIYKSETFKWIYDRYKTDFLVGGVVPSPDWIYLHVLAYLGGIVGLVLDHCNKVTITIKWVKWISPSQCK